MADIWVEKYRPHSIDSYIFKDEVLKKQVTKWIKEGELPGHLLLAGPPGCGKTSLALMILNELNVPKEDILMINGSLEGRVLDTLRGKITGFCDTLSLSGGKKYVIVDEFDYTGHHIQPAMRNFIEKYSPVARFIFTCNYPSKILDAIHSRTQLIHFENMNEESFLNKAMEILSAENIEYDPEHLVVFYEKTFPDFRKFLNELSSHVDNGKLMPYANASTGISTNNAIDEMISLIGAGKITQARQVVCESFDEQEYGELYRYFYDNLGIFSSDALKQAEIIIHIADYMYKDAIVADREINLAACFVKIMEVVDAP